MYGIHKEIGFSYWSVKYLQMNCMQLFCYIVIVSLILPLGASNKGDGLMVNPWWVYM